MCLGICQAAVHFYSDCILEIVGMEEQDQEFEKQAVYWFEIGVETLQRLNNVDLETDFWVQYLIFASKRSWNGRQLTKLNVKGNRLARNWNAVQAQFLKIVNCDNQNEVEMA